MSAKTLLFFLLTLSIPFITKPASANSFSVSGTAFSAAVEQSVNLAGGPLSITSATPSGPELFQIVQPGAAILSLFVDIFSDCSRCASVTFGSQFTDIVNGGLTFSGTFTAPSAPGGFSLTFPVSMTGNAIAFQDLTLGQGIRTQGPLIFDLRFNGSGTITVGGTVTSNGDDLQTATVSFNGVATTVPEPSSLLLLGSGLGVIGMRWKRRSVKF